MEQISRIGMDTSKHVFQLHGVNAAEVPVLRKKVRRKAIAYLEAAWIAAGVPRRLAWILVNSAPSRKICAE